MKVLVFVMHKPSQVEKECTKVEGAWSNRDKTEWVDAQGERIADSVFSKEDRFFFPGFGAKLCHAIDSTIPTLEDNTETVEIVLVTSKKTAEGIWMFRGWLVQCYEEVSKITLGMYIPSLHSGMLILMSAEELEQERELRASEGLAQLPADITFMRWNRHPGEPKELFLRALLYASINTTEY